MPELPEVETIKLGLQDKIIGKKVTDIEILVPKIFQGDKKKIIGKTVVGIWRRAKILGVELNLDARGPAAPVSRRPSSEDLWARRREPSFASPLASTLLFHLKMTGQLIYIASSEKREMRLIGGHPTPDMRDEMPNKTTRVVFEFDDGGKLYFNDMRRFGWVRVVDSGQVTGDSSIKKLGPEPLEKDFTWEVLKNNLLKHKSQPVKVAIMDQSVVSGVGNIYSNESLFEAGIDPRRKVSTLSDEEFKKLHQGIIKSLETGIKYGGSTRAQFVNVDGEKGYFLDYAKVYWKEGQKCKVCSGKIQKVQLRGRGTYFCPKCQK